MTDTLIFAALFFGIVGVLCWLTGKLAGWMIQRDYDRLRDEYRWME